MKKKTREKGKEEKEIIIIGRAEDDDSALGYCIDPETLFLELAYIGHHIVSSKTNSLLTKLFYL